jgi:ribosome-associated protein
LIDTAPVPAPEKAKGPSLSPDALHTLILQSLDDDQAQEVVTKKAGRHARIEGLPSADWVLIDAEDVIVHLFRPEVRSFYNLERMWAFGDAPEVAQA